MSGKEFSAKMRIDGDASKLKAELRDSEAELRRLSTTGKEITILETALGNVQRLEGELTAAQAKVRQLGAAYDEALNSDADAPLLRSLEGDLKRAEREANKAAEALLNAKSAVVSLNLAAGEAGVRTGNLAQKKAELAQETVKVKTRIDELRGSIVETERAERTLTAGTSTLNSAFDKLGIRSAEKIQAEITGINQSLQRLALNGKVSGAEFDRAYAAAQARLAALRTELAGVEQPATKLKASVSGVGDALATLAAPVAGLALVQQFISANVAAESLQRTLVQLTGSGQLAQGELDYLRATSERLGLAVNETGRAYVSLMASARGTAMEGESTRRIFEAVAGSMAKLGKSSADTEGALQAVAQMMSKGIVSAEEWRQQLGERLPGAAQATADALGITVDELNDMIGTGNVLASEVLPYLSQGLEKVYGTAGRVDGSVAAWNRLKNAVADTMTFVGDSGVWSGVVTLLEQGAIAVRGLTGGFELLAKTAGITLAAIATFDWRHPIDSVRNWKTAVAEAAETIQAKLDKAKSSADGAAAAQGKLAAETAQGGAAAQQAGASWLAVVTAYAKVTKAAEENVSLAAKSAAARAEEGKAAVALAQAFGSESEKRSAALQAARTDADALRAVADARRMEAEVVRSNAAALAAAAGPEKAWTDEKRKQIDAVKKVAEAKGAEADQAAAAAVSANQHAAALAIETEKLKDHSGSLVELKAAAETAAVALENMRSLKEQGAATTTQLRDAELAAAQATALYRDALNDQTKAIEYNAKTVQSKSDLAAAGIRLEIEQAKSMAQVAKAYGDETTAADMLNRAKQLEIELAELTAAAKRAEAQSQQQIIAAKRAELQASGDLTVEKQRELKAQELSAQIKMKEADIAAETADRMRQLAAATGESAGQAEAAAGDYDRLAGSLDGVAESASRAASAQAGVSSNGVRGPAQPRTGQADLLAEAYKRGASVEEGRIMKEVMGEIYNAKLATLKFLGTDDYVRKINRITNETIDEARAIARDKLAAGEGKGGRATFDELSARELARLDFRNDVTGTRAVPKIQDAYRRAGQQTLSSLGAEAATRKTHRIELVSGQTAAAFSADSEADVNNLLAILGQHKLRAGQ